MSAVLAEYPQAVNALVEVEGVKVELYTTTPLFEACRCGRLAVLQQLLESELVDTNQPAVCEFLALALAGGVAWAYSQLCSLAQWHAATAGAAPAPVPPDCHCDHTSS